MLFVDGQDLPCLWLVVYASGQAFEAGVPGVVQQAIVPYRALFGV